ncbi:hypothetical protein HA402_005796 [Bradysia odoriphaga]|nr:hypothetical protein HA402_005796 [Bradysia odoriphaga]
MIIVLFCAYFCSFVLTSNGLECNPCDCTNPVYTDQPTNIVQCWSKTKFYDQVHANFAIVNSFLDQPSAKACNYTAYRNIVNKMKNSIFHIIDAYFECKECDCVEAIMNAQQEYNKVVSTLFAPTLACSYVIWEPECSVNIKHATYFSCENILTTLIGCANLKSSCQRPNIRLLISELISKKTVDCNCVEIDDRPIPVSEEQCYSPEYISTVKKFITDNFDRVKETYHNASIANPHCDYTEFVKDVTDLGEKTIQWPNILQHEYPTFEEILKFLDQLRSAATQINQKIRAYIIKKTKRCYFTPRQLRQSVLTISNYALQILTKCVTYRDPKNSFC